MKALMHFQEMDLPWSDLHTLPRSHLAFVGLLSFAVTEMNILAKMFLCQLHDETDEKAINRLGITHRFVVLRSWSSKLYEVRQALDLKKLGTLEKDKRLSEFCDAARKSFDALNENESYSIAKYVRNEASHHYSLRAAIDNVQSAPTDGVTTQYLAKLNGNSFFPIGEDLIFTARLDRRWKNSPNIEERMKEFDGWLTWNLAANRWLSNVHAEAFASFVCEPLEITRLRRRSYWVKDSFVGNPTEALTPLYLIDGGRMAT
ncbi:MAG: hypothetical protein AAGA15_10820 [Pseudomonadota bacterium]